MTVELCAPDGTAAIEALHNVELLPVASLCPADSTRLNGISHRHVEVLAKSKARCLPSWCSGAPCASSTACTGPRGAARGLRQHRRAIRGRGR